MGPVDDDRRAMIAEFGVRFTVVIAFTTVGFLVLSVIAAIESKWPNAIFALVCGAGLGVVLGFRLRRANGG